MKAKIKTLKGDLLELEIKSEKQTFKKILEKSEIRNLIEILDNAII